MNLENYKHDLVHGSLVDYYFSNYWWTKNQKFIPDGFDIEA